MKYLIWKQCCEYTKVEDCSHSPKLLWRYLTANIQLCVYKYVNNKELNIKVNIQQKGAVLEFRVITFCVDGHTCKNPSCMLYSDNIVTLPSIAQTQLATVGRGCNLAVICISITKHCYRNEESYPIAFL